MSVARALDAKSSSLAATMDHELIDRIVLATGLEPGQVRKVLREIERIGYTFVRLEPAPRKLRCRRCRRLFPHYEIVRQLCQACRDVHPDDRDRPKSVSSIPTAVETNRRRH